LIVSFSAEAMDRKHKVLWCKRLYIMARRDCRL